MPTVSSADGGYRYYARNLTELEDELRESAKKREEARDQRLKEMEEAYKASNLRAEKAFQESSEEIRQRYAGSAEEEKRALREERESLKTQTYDRYGNMQGDLEFERKRAAKGIEDLERDHAHQREKLAQTSDNRFEKFRHEVTRREDENERNRNLSHFQDTTEWRARVGDLLEVKKQYERSKADGAAEARKDVEDTQRLREQQLVDWHDTETRNLANQRAASERILVTKFGEALKEKEGHYQNIVAEQNEANRQTYDALRDAIDRTTAEHDAQRAKDRELSERTQTEQLHAAYVDREEVLKKQAEVAQQSLEYQRRLDDERIAALQKELDRKKTNTDISDIPPAAEEHLRRTYLAQQDKILTVAEERNAAKIESIQENTREKMRQVLEDSSERERAMHKRLTDDMLTEKSQLVKHVEELDYNRVQDGMNREKDHERKTADITHRYSLLLEDQRRRYDEAFDSIRTESTARLRAEREESDFNLKMAQRAFAIRLNDSIREYERQLLDQKNDSEIALHEVKAQLESSAREGEQRARITLDEQARGHEQRQAQLEAQYQERERMLTQGYQEEIDKLKRSHALLSKKKS